MKKYKFITIDNKTSSFEFNKEPKIIEIENPEKYIFPVTTIRGIEANLRPVNNIGNFKPLKVSKPIVYDWYYVYLNLR